MNRWMIVIAVALIPALSNPVVADSFEEEKAYQKTLDETVFVMLPSYSGSDGRGGSNPIQSPSGKPYPTSGLYPKDGSVTPLWTVDWYATDVHLSPDGRYLAREGPWPTTPHDLAIAFYDRGKLVKRYAIDELVEDPDTLPRSVSHFTWKRLARLDPSSKVLGVVTLEEMVHTFALATGEKLTSEKIQVPSFTVELEDLSGTRQTLNDFQMKKGPMVSTMVEMYGEAARLVLSGDTNIRHNPETGSTSSSGVTYPFPMISNAARTAVTNEHELYWTVTKKTGESEIIRVQRRPDGVSFEGTDPTGARVEIPAHEIRKLEFAAE